MRKMAFALFICAAVALAPVAAWAEEAQPIAAPDVTELATQSPEETPPVSGDADDNPEEPTPSPGATTSTAYTKKSAYLYKAKKPSPRARARWVRTRRSR